MEWNNVVNDLPPKAGTYVGLCFQETGPKTFWTGIVEVLFEPQKGWIRAESGTRDVYVIYWAEMPELPEA